MAPLAPIVGTVDAQLAQRWANPGSPAAQEVEQKKPDRAHAVFHVVAEDVEEPHVSEDVQEPAVKEHEGEQGEDLLTGGKVRCHLRHGVAGRDKAVHVDKALEVLPLHHLIQKNEDVHADNAPGDDGVAF